ncbi:MAG TPA: hypothetical protein VGJ33_10905 [Candidatus Angelobacter sp.]
MPTTQAAAQAAADALPSNPQSSCTVSPQTFNSWFQSGSAAVNGVVIPANSVNFPTNNTNCDFYQWSMQMFLWLTSPAPPSYGGGSFVFDSPVFYDVSPADSKGNRAYSQHQPGRFIFSVRANKPGPDDLQLVFATDGRVLQVHPRHLSTTGKDLVLTSPNKQVEAAQVTVKDHKAQFLDKTGKPIPNVKLVFPPNLITSKFVPVQKFIVNGKSVFVDSSGNVIDTEEGQADGGVFLTQGSPSTQSNLIYYTTVTNDVYAYFLTQTKRTLTPQKVINAQFPTTQANVSSISQYFNNKNFPDAKAAAVEVKLSWVAASSIPNKSQYITMQASVPVYQANSGNTQWTQTGQTKNVELALVGIHVVGSVQGHPEMLWATFEHFGNTPNAAYQYLASPAPGTITTVNQNTAGTWLFAANNAGSPFNCMNQKAESQSGSSTGNVNIVLNTPSTPCTAPTQISASNTIRWKVFGAAYNQPPNSVDSTPVSNSSIISVNNATQIPAATSGRGQNAAGQDIRDNYFMLGSTWTVGGKAPTSSYGMQPSPTPSPTPNEVGTSVLANTTMETFVQGNSNSVGKPNQNGLNCFDCHNNNMPPSYAPPNQLATVPISHIFCDSFNSTTGCSGGLVPLPIPVAKSVKKR